MVCETEKRFAVTIARDFRKKFYSLPAKGKAFHPFQTFRRINTLVASKMLLGGIEGDEYWQCKGF
jgi:hypothetical protein